MIRILIDHWYPNTIGVFVQVSYEVLSDPLGGQELQIPH